MRISSGIALQIATSLVRYGEVLCSPCNSCADTVNSSNKLFGALEQVVQGLLLLLLMLKYFLGSRRNPEADWLSVQEDHYNNKNLIKFEWACGRWGFVCLR